MAEDVRWPPFRKPSKRNRKTTALDDSAALASTSVLDDNTHHPETADCIMSTVVVLERPSPSSSTRTNSSANNLMLRTRSWTPVSLSSTCHAVDALFDEVPVVDEDNLDDYESDEEDDAYRRRIDEKMTRSTSVTGTVLEAKIKAIAQYLNQHQWKSVTKGSCASGFVPILAARNNGIATKHGMFVRRGTLSQYTTHKSAPDVLAQHRSPKRVHYGADVHIATTPTVSVGWNDDIVGTTCTMIDENEVVGAPPVSQTQTPLSTSSPSIATSAATIMPASTSVAVPTSSSKSRKRGRSNIAQCGLGGCELFKPHDEERLRRLCDQCHVPSGNVNAVIVMVTKAFGKPTLDVTILDALVGDDNIVLFMGMVVFGLMDPTEEYLDLARLPVFLRHVQTRYRTENAFHNACHAADVMHTMFMMLWGTALGDKIATYNQIGALLAAIMHDIEHVGLTNDFLIKTNHEIAQRFPTKAPMESMHTSMAVDLLGDPAYGLLHKMTPTEQANVLATVREVILATALCYQKDMLAELQQVPSEAWQTIEETADDADDTELLPQALQVLVLRVATHVSDISQTMKPFDVHKKWVFRLNEEHFCQGDLDTAHGYGVSPAFCFRQSFSHVDFLQSQVGFLTHCALPAVDALNQLPWLNVQVLVDGIQQNIAEWKRQLDHEQQLVPNTTAA